MDGMATTVVSAIIYLGDWGGLLNTYEDDTKQSVSMPASDLIHLFFPPSVLCITTPPNYVVVMHERFPSTPANIGFCVRFFLFSAYDRYHTYYALSMYVHPIPWSLPRPVCHDRYIQRYILHHRHRHPAIGRGKTPACMESGHVCDDPSTHPPCPHM